MEFKLPFSIPHFYRIEKRIHLNIPDDFKKEFPEISSTKRLNEFFHGRSLAKTALKELTGQNFPWLKRDSRGLPHWPEGTSGSISHHDDWAAVWVGPNSEALGVDLQTWLDESQSQKIMKAMILRMGSVPDEIPGKNLSRKMTLVFCIFEVIQKCLGNRGFEPISVAGITWGQIGNPTWSMDLKTGQKNLKIEGFWSESEAFCVAFGRL
jgi:hypothetical protein